MKTLGREEILGLIPHAGTMCLLDGAQRWDESTIFCVSSRYAQPDNPLRRADGTLGSACLIEIASQAMALHARLCAANNAPPRPGFLVSLREVQLCFATLGDEHGALTIVARRLLGDARGASYEFNVRAGGELLAEGRAMILFEAAI
ncbi:phosphotransferase [Acidocella sp.]|uniref:phosphotransferase n=1 Tax=Acidocella sp. TaxID=50710 RepID=UPI002630D41B|nr:phosphotransferase [Acidocella sp.]